MHRWVRSLSNHGATVPIFGHAALLIASNNRKLDTLESHESLSDIVIGGRINSTTLGVAKKLIKRIIGSTLADLVRVIVELLRWVDSIIDRPIGRILWGTSVEASGRTSRMLLTIGTLAHGTIWILIATRCSGKRLQVSDHCRTRVRNWKEK
jgi:hypothetical protein